MNESVQYLQGRIGIICQHDYKKYLKSGESKFPTFEKLILTLKMNFWVAFSLTTRQGSTKT